MSFEVVQPDYNDDYNYPPLSRKDLIFRFNKAKRFSSKKTKSNKF